MSEHKKITKNKLQRRNSNNSNDSFKKKNIFQLITPINKIRKSVNITKKNKILFAENIICFLKEYHLEELLKVNFDENIDNIETLICSLTSILLDLNYTLLHDDNDNNDCDIKILYDIDVGDWVWNLFDVIVIDKIPVKEFQIAFAYFLKNLSIHCYHSAIDSSYNNQDSTEYDSYFEMIEDEESCYNDNDEFDEGIYEEKQNSSHEELNRLRLLKEKFDSYLLEPYELFINYVPKNDFEIKSKQLLIELINLDYSIIRKFIPDEEVHNDNGVHFYENFIIYLDSETKGVESEHFNHMNENANNGISNPAGFFSVENTVVKNETTKEDIEYFKTFLKYFHRIYDDFLNKL